jgi:hypothetical protein
MVPKESRRKNNSLNSFKRKSKLWNGGWNKKSWNKKQIRLINSCKIITQNKNKNITKEGEN